jgi:uroporphyrinogen III methyltransferase/synthase
VTRPPDQAEDFLAALVGAGYRTISLPAISIEGKPLSEAMVEDFRLLAAGHFNWLVFTSTNSVRHFARLLECSERRLPDSGLKLAAQGERTAQACLAALGRRVDFVPRSAVSEDFADELLEHLPATSRIFFPHAAETRGMLLNRLQGGGVEIASHIVYTTVPIKLIPDETLGKLCQSDNLVFTFFSPSAVRAVSTALGPAQDLLRRYPICSIGVVTSRAIRELGLTVAAESREQSGAGLLEAIKGLSI